MQDIGLRIKNKITTKLSRGRYLYGFQGMINMLVPYFVTLQFADEIEAVISALVGLFMFIEHKDFGFKRRIAQSLVFVGMQIILVVTIAVFFSDHHYLAILFNFILFFSLNYYSYFNTPNTITLVSIQYFYLFALTSPIDVDFLPVRIGAVLVALIFSAIGMLVIWPTKTHRIIELKLKVYLRNTRLILEKEIPQYAFISNSFKQAQKERFSDIMNILYSLKYGNIFSTTKGRYLFKFAVNTQILNNSLHTLKKTESLAEFKKIKDFNSISELWRDKLIKIIQLLEKTVVEDKHSLLLVEEAYEDLNVTTRKIILLLEKEGLEDLKLKFSEIDYLVNTLIKFSKSLILFRHKTEYVESSRVSFLYNFDNFKNNIVRSLTLEQGSVRFALHTSILLTTSLFLIAHFNIFEGFWIPMTILLIIKPSQGGTLQQTIKRVSGTIIGLLISYFIINFLPAEVMPYAMVVSIFFTIAMIKEEYGIAVAFITIGVVLLLYDDFETSNIFIVRFLFTAVTAIIVITSSYFILPNWSGNSIKNQLIETLQNDIIVLKYILEKAAGTNVNEDKIRLSILNSYQGRKQTIDLYMKMKSEPKSKQLNSEVGKQFLVAHERFGENYSRFVYEILAKETKVDLPYSRIKKVFVQVLKNSISNLENKKINIKSDQEALSDLFAFLVDKSTDTTLTDEQRLVIFDLKKMTKRLMELSNLSENKS